MDAPVRRNEFHIVGGDDAGTVLRIPPGRVTVGSGEEANVQLAFPGVSKLHALLTPMKQRIILEDNGSKYGTWVNGERIGSPTEIVDGDLLRFGSVRVRFRQRAVAVRARRPPGGNRERGNGERGATGERKESVGAAVVFAAVINVAGLIGNGAAAFLTELTPTWSWFITPVAGLVVAITTELIGHYRKSSAPAPAQPRPGPRPGVPPPPPRRRTGRLVATVFITVLLLGGGGWLLTTAASTAVGYFSGNEDGMQRLEAPVVREVQGVSVSVQSVLSTPHFTRVEILVRNQTDSSLSLPLFQNCALTAGDGETFDADPFRSKWGTEIAAGGQRNGTINFEGQLPKGATTATLSFATIFGMGPETPLSISLTDIRLVPMAGGSPGR